MTSEDVNKMIRASTDASVEGAKYKLLQALGSLLSASGELPREKAGLAGEICSEQAGPMVEEMIDRFKAIIEAHNEFGCNPESWGEHAAERVRAAVDGLFSVAWQKLPHGSQMVNLPGEDPGRDALHKFEREKRDTNDALSRKVAGTFRMLGLSQLKTQSDSSQEPPQPPAISIQEEDPLIIRKLNDFYTELIAHQALWLSSLKPGGMSEKPARNREELSKQLQKLNVLFGELKEIIARFMGHAQAWDSALIDDVAIRKGPNLELVVGRFPQVIGAARDAHANGTLELADIVENPARRGPALTIIVFLLALASIVFLAGLFITEASDNWKIFACVTSGIIILSAITLRALGVISEDDLKTVVHNLTRATPKKGG